MNPNVIADSKHRAVRQYAAAPAPLTGFGAFDDEPEELGYCWACNGSGEGMHEGQTCRVCGGKGEA